MGVGTSTTISLTAAQASELKWLMAKQVSEMKDLGISDVDIKTKIQTFYGFHSHKKPTIIIKRNGTEPELSPKAMKKKHSKFIDFDPDESVAVNIYALYHALEVPEDQIKEKMSDFTYFLEMLEKEALLATAAAEKANHEPRRGRRSDPTHTRRSSFIDLDSTLPSVSRRGSVALDAIHEVRRGSQMDMQASTASFTATNLLSTTGRRGSQLDTSRRGSQVEVSNRRGSHIEPLDKITRTPKRSSILELPAEIPTNRRGSLIALDVDLTGKLQPLPDLAPRGKSLSPTVLRAIEKPAESSAFYRDREKAPLPWQYPKSPKTSFPTQEAVATEMNNPHEIPVIGIDASEDDDDEQLFPETAVVPERSTTAAHVEEHDDVHTDVPEVVLAAMEETPAHRHLCGVCSMTFKSHGALDRHLNYSSMHASILEGYVCSVFDFTEELPPLDVELDGIDAADEMPHYELLFSDSKLFWRTQDTVVVDFYLHSTLNCLEAVLHSSKHKEKHSLYFDYKLLNTNIHKHYGQMKNVKAFNEAMASFVIERLFQDKGSTRIVYQSHTNDYMEIFPLLQTPPVNIVSAGAHEHRLHRSSSYDIDVAVVGLANENELLHKDTAAAERRSLAASQSIAEMQKITIPAIVKPDLVRRVSSGEFSPVFDNLRKREKDWKSPNSKSAMSEDNAVHLDRK